MFSETAIKVTGLSKCYRIYKKPSDRLLQMLNPKKQYFREFWALKNISFEIKRGETVGIVGRNGSGKSTLLQLICGTLNPTAGTILKSGRIAALLELGSGFNPDFTGRENVYLNGRILGLNSNEIDSRFNEIIKFADIGDFLDQPIKSYSSGMVVRLAFSVAINVEPQILVVDEALSVGDELFQRKCFSKIETMRKNGATILLVSHSAAAVVDLCDRALLIDSGELLAVGKPKQIVGNYQKLLYAPPEKRASIRNTILQTPQLELESNRSEENSIHCTSDAPIDTQLVEETFDPEFLPQSTLVYESLGAFIQNVSMTNILGHPVNGLVRGRSYRFLYRVTFNQTVTKVRFAMLIKSTSGMPLGGGLSASSAEHGVAVIDPGQSFSIEFKFNCHLNPGVYFLNAGVFGCANSDEEVVLHRKADVLVFRVLPVPGNRSTEIIDFGFDCRAEIDA